MMILINNNYISPDRIKDLRHSVRHNIPEISNFDHFLTRPLPEAICFCDLIIASFVSLPRYPMLMQIAPRQLFPHLTENSRESKKDIYRFKSFISAGLNIIITSLDGFWLQEYSYIFSQ